MVCLTKYDHMVVDNRAAGLAGIKPGLRTPAASLLLTSPNVSGFGFAICCSIIVAEQLNENATHS